MKKVQFCNSYASFIFRIIRIGPIAKINKPISDRFRADKHNHYLSMISKIKPSPDWFVGIDRFDLCNASTCKWKTNITIQLTPYDAGNVQIIFHSHIATL